MDDAGSDPDLVRELAELAAEFARGAAALVRRFSARRVVVSTKSTDTDLVTDADRATERWLVAQIARARPGDATLGEEGGARAGRTGVRWVLDPIDGTVNFVLGLRRYAVSVAAEVDGAAVAGAVCDAASGELFRAQRGGGAYLDGRRLHGPRPVPLAQAVLGTGFGYDAGVRARQGELLAAVLPRVADIRRLGSASLDLCAVAVGRLDGYFETGLSPWDHAAGALIASEAGCLVSGLRAEPPDERLTAVAGPVAAAELFSLLDELLAGPLSSSGSTSQPSARPS
ncbi:MAG: inositol monophosphatase family protein [Jatrophihabitantaceae bacterium]